MKPTDWRVLGMDLALGALDHRFLTSHVLLCVAGLGYFFPLFTAFLASVVRLLLALNWQLPGTREAPCGTVR